jgi:hypothetical protein
MSMAGYDFIIELSQPLLERMVLSKILNYVNQAEGEEFHELGDLTLPFDFYQEIPLYGDYSALFHIIVHAPTIDLKANNRIIINIALKKGSLNIGNHTFISKINANFEIQIPIDLVNQPNNQKAIVVDTSAATVSFAFDNNSRTNITNAINSLSSLGSYIPDNVPELPKDYTIPTEIKFPTVTQLENSFTTNVQRILSNSGKIQLASFTVKSGADGTLQPLIFTNLELHTIPSTVRKEQALGLYGNFLADSQVTFNQTKTTIRPGQDVSVRLSKKAFQKLVFCPAMAASFNTTVDKLPLACGNSGNKITQSTSFGYIKIDSLQLDLKPAENTMQIGGHCEVILNWVDFQDLLHDDGVNEVFLDTLKTIAANACIDEITAHFSAQIKLQIVNGALKPEVTNIDVNPNVELELICLLIPLVGPIAHIIVNWLADEYFAVDAETQVYNQIAAGLQGMTGIDGNFGAINIKFEEAMVYAEDSFFIGGRIEGVDLPPAGEADVDVDADEEVIGTNMDSLTWSDPDHWCQYVCDKKYTYKDYYNDIEVTAIATPILLGRPIKYEWFIKPIGVSGGPYYMQGSSGVVTPTVIIKTSRGECRMPDVSSGQVSLDYNINIDPLGSKNGDIIKLRNKEYCNYIFYLEVTATDVEGVQVHGFDMVDINGQYKTGTLEYSQDVMKCRMERARGRIPKALEIADMLTYMRSIDPKFTSEELKTLNLERLVNKVSNLIDNLNQPKLQRSFGKRISKTMTLQQQQMIAQMGLSIREAESSLKTRLSSNLRELSEMGELSGSSRGK